MGSCWRFRLIEWETAGRRNRIPGGKPRDSCTFEAGTHLLKRVRASHLAEFLAPQSRSTDA